MKKSTFSEFIISENTRASKRSSVPEPLGSTPIPEDHIRLYHYTSADGDTVRKEGLRLSKARGSTYGEPNMIWASSQPPGDHKRIVEFAMPADDPALGLERPRPGADLEKWQAGDYHVGIFRDITPAEIISIHEPWHYLYRYIVNDKDGISKALNGEYNIPKHYVPEYTAIEAIKKDYG